MKKIFAALFLSLLSVLANADDKTLVQEANVALAQKDFKTAFAKFSVLAEQGKPAAQFNLGAFYLNGQGVEKNEKLAFEWFRKSADQGNSRALQVIERAAAQGNEYAKSELRKIQGQPEPVPEPQVQQPLVKSQEKPLEKLQEKPLEKLQEKPVAKSQEKQEKPLTKARGTSKVAENMLVYSDPTVARPGKWAYGISANLAMYKSAEPLYYPVGAVLNSTTQSYTASQPGLSFWVGYDDISVMATFAKRSGSVAATVPSVGALSKSFSARETAIDVRWLIHQFSSPYFMPYVLAGFALNTASGTEDEVTFQDVFSQKDSMLMAGAGAIIPIDEKMGFRVDGRMGSDSQTSYGKYLAGPGVTLSFPAYKYTANATFSRINATMYYKISGGWNAQAGFKYGSYSAGVGPAFSDTTLYATVGYTYR